jgi:hypothetical protein
MLTEERPNRSQPSPSSQPSSDELRERWVQRFREAALRCAEEEAKLVGLRAKKSILVALLMRANASEHHSVAAQEREAYASEDYAHYVDDLQAQEAVVGRLKAEVAAIEMNTSLYQSQKAYERAEMRAYS